MRILLFVIVNLILNGCGVSQYQPNHDMNIELKNSIIDGFFNGDSTQIPPNTFFISSSDITESNCHPHHGEVVY